MKISKINTCNNTKSKNTHTMRHRLMLLLLIALTLYTLSATANNTMCKERYNASITIKGDSSLVISYQELAAKVSAANKSEVLPEFPRGDNKFANYIKSKLIYPYQARANNISGRVIVGFTIEKCGSLSDIKVLKGIGYGCDEEVVRILKSCPKWEPGLQDGKPVRVYFTMPITFQLAK